MFNVSLKLKRGPQVVLTKDVGAILSTTGLQSGDKVVDVGAGSGWLAVRLGAIVAPKGRVYSYERRDDFAGLAQENVEKAGLAKVVRIVRKDAFEGFKQDEIDLVTLDLADSRLLLGEAHRVLKEKGFCVGYLPNVEQAKEFVLEGESKGFRHFKTIEIIERSWLVREQGCRPENTGLMHTAFLSFLRKQAANPEASRAPETNAQPRKASDEPRQ